MEHTNKKLKLVFGDVVLGVHGDGFSYLFSYQTGGIESLCIGGKEWLYRTPTPTFWRASTDNDRGCGFPNRSAMWLGADLFWKTEKVTVEKDGCPVEQFLAPDNNRFGGPVGAEQVTICCIGHTATVPAAEVVMKYTVTGDGAIHVEVSYEGQKGLPELPVFGMRFVMPTAADGYEWDGLSGETYPDRMAGGVNGIWKENGLPVTPYLVPQDCGVHMETQRLTITRSTVLANEMGEKNPFSISFEAGERPFAFSCLPYTASELENALHQEELPPARRTVVCILGAVRGVGGIDSWGSDVEEAYRISAEKAISYDFWIRGLPTGR